jgi:hypothetical protein
MTAELQGEERSECHPWTLLHMDNEKMHISKWNLARIEELLFKHIADPLFSLDIARSDFIRFGWPKGWLSFRSIVDITEFFKVLEEMLSILTAETIARVFQTGSKD